MSLKNNVRDGKKKEWHSSPSSTSTPNGLLELSFQRHIQIPAAINHQETVLLAVPKMICAGISMQINIKPFSCRSGSMLEIGHYFIVNCAWLNVNALRFQPLWRRLRGSVVRRGTRLSQRRVSLSRSTATYHDSDLMWWRVVEPSKVSTCFPIVCFPISDCRKYCFVITPFASCLKKTWFDAFTVFFHLR